ncbi:hypothetical protein VTK26DRAFT_7722 [Humicola hyalothermophila]
MSSEPLRRVGRGGAGNFYSKRDIQEAEQSDSAHRDLEAEAQAPSGNPLHRAQTHSAAEIAGPSYARSGRGGAGNFILNSPFTSTISSATGPATGPSPTGSPTPAAPAAATTLIQRSPTAAEVEADLAGRTQAAALAAVAAAQSKPSGGGRLSGRGGAGNWRDGSTADVGDQRRKEEEMEEVLRRAALRDVEIGLAVPARVYRGQSHHRPGGRGSGAGGEGEDGLG